MIKSAGHAVDLRRESADYLGGVPPCRGHRREFFDDGTRLRQRECEELRCRLQEIDGAGALVEIEAPLRSRPDLIIMNSGRVLTCVRP